MTDTDMAAEADAGRQAGDEAVQRPTPGGPGVSRPGQSVSIHTDGACSGNPGPGGWGALLRYGVHEKSLSGYAANTTNNRMELLAAIYALEALKRPCEVTLVTDSNYLRDGITRWIHQWKRRRWRKSDGKAVSNVDLWKRLDSARERHRVAWQWIKGHAGDPGNEAADELARQAIQKGRVGELHSDPVGMMTAGQSGPMADADLSFTTTMGEKHVRGSATGGQGTAEQQSDLQEAS